MSPSSAPSSLSTSASPAKASKPSRALLVSAFMAALSFACSDGGEEEVTTTGSGSGGDSGTTSGSTATGSGGSTADPNQLPADTSQAGIEAFLAAESYKTWTGDAAPRPGDSAVNIHGDALRVYFNTLALQAAQNRDTYATLTQEQKDAATPEEEGEVPVGGMLIKEIYDPATSTREGTAVSIKTDTGWVYYCNDTGERCGVGSDGRLPTPVYSAPGQTKTCNTCHGDIPYAPIP